jgi:hypothetical protein
MTSMMLRLSWNWVACPSRIYRCAGAHHDGLPPAVWILNFVVIIKAKALEPQISKIVRLQVGCRFEAKRAQSASRSWRHNADASTEELHSGWSRACRFAMQSADRLSAVARGPEVDLRVKVSGFLATSSSSTPVAAPMALMLRRPGRLICSGPQFTFTFVLKAVTPGSCTNRRAVSADARFTPTTKP